LRVVVLPPPAPSYIGGGFYGVVVGFGFRFLLWLCTKRGGFCEIIECFSYLLRCEMFPFNDPYMKERRQDLRNRAPNCEKIVWKYLKWKQLHWVKWRRQYGVWKYVLDFYCPELRLWIEIDGRSHVWNEKYDQERTEYINDHWIEIIRYTNEEVYANLDRVIRDIQSYCEKISKE